MNEKLLKLKTITSTDKLVLMLMMDFPVFLSPINLRTTEMAKSLGTTRKDIKESLNNLVNVGYITTSVDSNNRSRETVLTSRFINIVNDFN